MKALKSAVLVGGILNLALALFHIVLCVQIHVAAHAAGYYPLMQMLAVGGTLLVAFLAYTSLAFREQLTMTTVGRSILLLNVALYGTRVIGELVLFPHPNPLIMVLCAGIAALYLWIIIVAKKLQT